MQTKITLQLRGLDPAQLDAAKELLPVLDLCPGQHGLPVDCAAGEGPLACWDGSVGRIGWRQPAQLFRMLGIFAENLKKGKPFSITEQPAYTDLCLMADCSRNGVLHFAAFSKLVRQLALMGYNSLQLYTEDTYQIEGYPYFGYQRGRYSPQELRRMDSYAARFGLELVPCIQTLAHLGSALKWEAFADIRDLQDILLADEEKSYALVDAMLHTMSANIRSRRINIGMDEAHLLGLGRYLLQHGYHDRMELMLRHFDRVMQLARKYGYQVMLWSDMFFRLASGGSYDSQADCPLDAASCRRIPQDATLIYWDYYAQDMEKYDRMLKQHLRMTPHVAFAGGAWKWTGYLPNSRLSEQTSLLADASCKKYGIRQVLVTAWGDNGAECPLDAVLPALQLWAELDYTGRHDDAWMEQRFATCVGGSYADFMHLGDPSLTPDNPAPGRCGVNAGKYLLYQDPLSGIFDAQVPQGADAHFAHCAARFDSCAARNPQWAGLFRFAASYCRVLAVKAELGLRLRAAYRAGDRTAAARIAKEDIAALAPLLRDFLRQVEAQWNAAYKPFGLEVLQQRLGGLLCRLEYAGQRVLDWAEGRIPALEELADEPLPYTGKAEDRNRAIWSPGWQDIVSACVVAG